MKPLAYRKCFKRIQSERIRSNYQKAVSKAFRELKEETTDIEEKQARAKIESDKKPQYDQKLANWKPDSLPTFWLAFILLGPLDYDYHPLYPIPRIAGKTTAGRRFLRGMEKDSRSYKGGNEEETAHPSKRPCVVDLTGEVTRGNEIIQSIAMSYARSVELRTLKERKEALGEILSFMQGQENQTDYQGYLISYRNTITAIANFSMLPNQVASQTTPPSSPESETSSTSGSSSSSPNSRAVGK